MLRRLLARRVLGWAGTAVAGSVGRRYVRRRLRRTLRARAARIGPTALVDAVRGAVHEGRSAASERERELRSRLPRR